MISFYCFSIQAIVYNNCSRFSVNNLPLYFSIRIKARGLRYSFIYIAMLAFLLFSLLRFSIFSTYLSKIDFSDLWCPKIRLMCLILTLS